MKSDERWLTRPEIVEMLVSEGYKTTRQAISKAINSGRLEVRKRRRFVGPKRWVWEIPESEMATFRAYLERTAKWRSKKTANPQYKNKKVPALASQPVEVVEARVRELRLRIPDDHERLAAWLMLLEGEPGSAPVPDREVSAS